MNKIISLTFLMLLSLALQSCTTTNATDRSGALDSVNVPSGITDCIAPKIISEDGLCQDPNELSWIKE